MKWGRHCTGVPDGLFGTYWGDICEQHDSLYRDYEKIMEREEADELFFERLKDRVPWYLAFIPYLYYYGVRFLPNVKASWKRWEYDWWFGVIAIKKKEYR
jgi:hypothetical protein